jgi:hypothetical protein
LKENQFFPMSSIDSHYTGDATKDVTKKALGKPYTGRKSETNTPAFHQLAAFVGYRRSFLQYRRDRALIFREQLPKLRLCAKVGWIILGELEIKGSVKRWFPSLYP